MTPVASLDDFRAWAARLDGLVFIGPDPHHVLGLEQLVPGLRVVSGAAPALDALRRGGAAVHRVPGDPGSAWELLQDEGAVRFVEQGRAAPRVLVFKASANLEALCRERGWDLLAPAARVARGWENKLRFAAWAARRGVLVPPSVTYAPGRDEAGTVLDTLGGDVVVQAPHGYGGLRTRRVCSASALVTAAEALRAPQLRVARHITGTSWTVDACVTERGLATTQPFAQLTGEPDLTPHALASCGNDMALTLDEATGWRRAAEEVATGLAADGFRGGCGLDFVLDRQGRAWLVEVNPRLVASTGLLTLAELGAGRLPLVARHIMALCAPEADAAPLGLHMAALPAGQIILHNLGQVAVTVAERIECRVAPAVEGDTGSPTRRAAPHSGPGDKSARGALPTSEPLRLGPDWLVATAAPGRPRMPATEVARALSTSRVVGDDGRLSASAAAYAARLYDRLGLRAVAASS